MSEAKKVCVVCGEDCSARPRVKDPEGRYMCKACLPARQGAVAGAKGGVGAAAGVAAAPVAVAAAARGDDVLGQLVEEVVSARGEPCPACSAPMNRDQVICVKCGFSIARGRQLRTHVQSAPKEARGRRKVEMPALSSTLVGPSIAGVMVLLGIAALASPPLTLLYYFALAVLGLGAWIYYIVAAFSDGDTGWGIMAFVPVLGIVTFIYALFLTQRPNLKWLYATMLLGTVGLLIIMSVNAEALEALSASLES